MTGRSDADSGSWPLHCSETDFAFALLLHHIDFIEKARTGIRRIRNEVRAQECPEPKFEANGFFTATFRPNPQLDFVQLDIGIRQAKQAGTMNQRVFK